MAQARNLWHPTRNLTALCVCKNLLLKGYQIEKGMHYLVRSNSSVIYYFDAYVYFNETNAKIDSINNDTAISLYAKGDWSLIISQQPIPLFEKTQGSLRFPITNVLVPRASLQPPLEALPVLVFKIKANETVYINKEDYRIPDLTVCTLGVSARPTLVFNKPPFMG